MSVENDSDGVVRYSVVLRDDSVSPCPSSRRKRCSKLFTTSARYLFVGKFKTKMILEEMVGRAG